MKNIIKEYIEYSIEEKEELWKTATFVFDTNVLLSLYRVSNKTRKDIIDSLEQLSTRIWIPYQVAYEFCKNRYEVICEMNNRFEDLRTAADKIVNEWRNVLRIESEDTDIESLRSYLKEWVDRKKENNYCDFDLINDEVFEKVLALFDGKTGVPFDDDEKSKIEKEGEERYKNAIPPGFKDNNKKENKYGDLLVWKEIINYSKEHDVDIILVIYDQKDDWWNKIKGKITGPRIELRKEFFDKTGHKFHMYTIPSFLSFWFNKNGKTIDKSTIEEVENITKEMKRKADKKNHRVKYKIVDDNKEKEAEKIRDNIAWIKMKNKKRMRSIGLIEKKFREGNITEEDIIAYKGNEEKINEGSVKIAKLMEKLEKLE